jgi:hypothetical protein
MAQSDSNNLSKYTGNMIDLTDISWHFARKYPSRQPAVHYSTALFHVIPAKAGIQ